MREPTLETVADEAVIRPEIRALIERGNVTKQDLVDLRGNSWEWEALVPAYDDATFLEKVEDVLANCARKRRPCSTYDDAMVEVYGPELLKRFKEQRRMNMSPKLVAAIEKAKMLIAAANKISAEYNAIWVEYKNHGNGRPTTETDPVAYLKTALRTYEIMDAADALIGKKNEACEAARRAVDEANNLFLEEVGLARWYNP